MVGGPACSEERGLQGQAQRSADLKEGTGGGGPGRLLAQSHRKVSACRGPPNSVNIYVPSVHLGSTGGGAEAEG